MIERIRTSIAAKHDEGASAIEYVLLAALLAVLLIGGITMFGNFLSDTFSDTCTAVTSASAELDSDCTVAE